MRSPFWRLRNRGLATQSVILVLAVVVVYAAVAWVAGYLGGAAGLAASATAAGLCLLGAELTLVVCHHFRDPKDAWRAVLLAVLPRMGIPLASALILLFVGGGLVKAGVLYYLVVFYPVTLAVETALTLPTKWADLAETEPFLQTRLRADD